MKWIEATVTLKDVSQFNEFLKKVVKPYVGDLYANHAGFTWHFFREPSPLIRVGFIGKYDEVLRPELSRRINESGLAEKHYYGAFMVEGDEYTGESEYYGQKMWEACYKSWEANSNLALALLDEPARVGFHATRGMHLLLNPMGFSRFQEGLLHLDQAVGLIREEAAYNDIFVKLYELNKEMLVRLKP